MDKIKDLYYGHFNGSEMHCALDTMPEVKDAEKAFADLTEHFAPEDFKDFEEVYNAYGAAYEAQGWIHGFRYAMQLVAACGIKGGAAQ